MDKRGFRVLQKGRGVVKIAVIMTTIYNPPNLPSILKSIEKEDFVVIALDRKTPQLEISDKRVHFIDLETQIKIYKNPIGVPFDCIQRRNFAYLYAIKYLDPDIIITIDDDNFLLYLSWAADHKKGLLTKKATVCNSKINILEEMLETKCNLHNNCKNVVHRGVPFENILDFENVEYSEEDVNIGINAGFWIGDPDINAYDRILHPNLSSVCKYNQHEIVINPNKWMHPFNSQNTGIIKSLFPCLFLIPMFETFYGYKIGRYDDIWQSYICQKIMAHHNLYIRFGDPIVSQKRNEHSVIKDLNEEKVGMIFTKKLIDELYKITLFGSSAITNMYEIADKFLLNDDKIFKYIGEKIVWWLGELKM
jgi:hypothetical protein